MFLLFDGLKTKECDKGMQLSCQEDFLADNVILTHTMVRECFGGPNQNEHGEIRLVSISQISLNIETKRFGTRCSWAVLVDTTARTKEESGSYDSLSI